MTRPGAPGRWGAIMAAGLALAAGSCAGRRGGAGAEGEIVESEGWSPADPADPVGTRRRSLAEALRKAVERVVGVYISARTRVEQSVSVDQKILANTEGYIRRYEILSEREEGGFVKTRVKALVLYRKLGEDLRQLGLSTAPAPPGNPRVAVLVTAKGASGADWGGRAAEAARRAFIEKGFTVVDGADRAQAPDLRVAGEADGAPIEDERLAGFRSFRARVTLQAAKPASGEVLASKTQEASGLDVADSIAAAKAMENAGYLAGAALASELSRGLRERTALTLRVQGIALERVGRLAEDLRLSPGIAAVTLSGMSGSRAELAVLTDGMAGDALAAELLRLKPYGFRLLAVTPYEVELEAGVR